MESDSSLSSLTDEDYTVSKKKKTVATTSAYKLRNVLKPPHTCTYSADTLYQWIHCGDIELEPEYQRDVVWPDVKQTKLIDSLLRNFYVPPIIFRVTDQDINGGEKRICIDGKQRLTSLQRFMDGQIPHCDNDTRKKYYFKPIPNGGRRTLLPDSLMKQLKQKQIVCIEYRELADQFEREIFQRVQMGMPLLPAERMAAISGPWAVFATMLKNEYLAPNSGGKCLADYLDTSRSRDFLAMAQVLIAVKSAPDRVQFHAATVDKWLQRVDGPDSSFKAKVRTVMDKFTTLVTNDAYTEVFIKSRLAPVEFVMIAFLISEQKDASFPELAELIADFRSSLRKVHIDIRSNNKVIKTAYDIVMSQRKGKGGISENRKRKKRATDGDEDEDMDEDDYRGTPVTKASKPATTRSRAGAAIATPRRSTTKSPSKSALKVHPPAPPELQTPASASPFPTNIPTATSSGMATQHTPVAGPSKPKLDGIEKLRAHRARQHVAQGSNSNPPMSSDSPMNGFGYPSQTNNVQPGMFGAVEDFFATQPQQQNEQHEGPHPINDQQPTQANSFGPNDVPRIQTPPRFMYPQNGTSPYQRAPQAQNQNQGQGSYFGNAGTLQDGSIHPRPANR